MATLFEKTEIKTLTIRNRMVRSATWEGMCTPDGRPTEKLIDLYQNLAKGGIGLIISGYTFVRPEGKQMPGKMGIHTDAFAEDFKKLTGRVHEAGGSIAIQLVHAGGQANSQVSGSQPIAPSAVEVKQFPEIPAEMTRNDIHAVVMAFGEGARRAKAWGFDAVQLHGAHGYLINQFLSPLTNRRQDEYGGTVENRCRFMLEVCQNVRQAVGDDYPIFIKLNALDYLDGGLTLEDGVYAAQKLSETGIDAIEVSSGTGASGKKNPAQAKIDSPEKEAYNRDVAMQIKKKVTCPVMVVGGFRSYDIAEKIIRDDGLDYISLSRPLIREPDLPALWMKGDRRPAKCISCNNCFKPGLHEGGIYCVMEKKEREKAIK